MRRPLPPLARWRGVRARRFLAGLMQARLAEKRATEGLNLFDPVLRRFRFSVPDGYRTPHQPVPIAKPKDGLPICLQPA